MWTTDQEFAAAIQARMPQGSMIVEMPYLDFPESQPINKMNDYDPVRPYLHSTGLRWTYGGIKGLPRSSWSARVVNQPPDRMLVAAAAAGASGLYIDRFGYLNENTSALEEGLRSGTGEEPLVSRDRRYAFFDIRGAARRIRTALGAARTRQLRSLVLNSPATFWQNDWQPAHVEGEADVQPSKGAAATLEIGNPGPARRFRLAFTVRVDGATTTQPVTIVWPDGLRQIQVVPAVDGYRLVRSFVLPHGPSRLSMSRADPGTLSLIEFRLRDPRRERLVNKALVASAE
jgi:phosphoglycerol transferase